MTSRKERLTQKPESKPRIVSDGIAPDIKIRWFTQQIRNYSAGLWLTREQLRIHRLVEPGAQIIKTLEEIDKDTQATVDAVIAEWKLIGTPDMDLLVVAKETQIGAAISELEGGRNANGELIKPGLREQLNNSILMAQINDRVGSTRALEAAKQQSLEAFRLEKLINHWERLLKELEA